MNKKILTLVISLFILLALPTVSLYYSYQGRQLRLNALKDLEVKSLLPESVTRQVAPNVRYRLLTSNCKDTASLNALMNQFIEEKVEFVYINDTTFNSMFSANQITDWKKKGTLSEITSLDYSIKNCDVILSNAKNEVLNTYSLLDNSKMKLVEHLAFLITKK